MDIKRDSLFGYPEFIEGRQNLTTLDGQFKEMLMNVDVYNMKAGEEKTFLLGTEELAILLMHGAVTFICDGKSHDASRSDLWADRASLIHVSRNIEVKVFAREDSDILVQSTMNENAFPSIFYKPSDIGISTFGQNLCGGTAVRDVATIFDYSNAPYSNMVIGESFTHQGSWSSYIPHSHPQPEVYYYKFDKPQGFGACFIGDEAFKIKDCSFSAITGGLTHPQVSAPGYKMYIVWMIRHLPGNPWTTRLDAPEHLWMVNVEF